jgi:hypothetical protein
MLWLTAQRGGRGGAQGGGTPLHWAAMSGNDDVAARLLAAGAAVDGINGVRPSVCS